jgi:spore coat protein CotH
MKPTSLIALLAAGTHLAVGWTALAEQGLVHFTPQGANVTLTVDGDSNDEWRFQSSSDLLTWNHAPALGTVFSEGTNSRLATLSALASGQGFYRAVKTTGIHDPFVVRTVSLTFTQSTWQTQLAALKTSGSNLVATLEVDGKSYGNVGVRYRGNTSYTGLGGSGAPTKKSVNLELDYVEATTRVMGRDTLNLNNAYTDESIMREPLYFNVMREYVVCPASGFAKLYINGVYWGLYCNTQQEDGDLIKEHFSSHDGDRWRAPNMAGGGGGPGGGGMGGGGAALTYLGTNLSSYKSVYELKSDHSTNAWERLQAATYALNKTAAAVFRDQIEDTFAVDRWLWFIALEIIFTDEDSYYYKGADYCFYYEPESGRMHPVEHDGNESSMPADSSLSPVQGAADANRPIIKQFLSVPELRQRYLAHMRTILQEWFNPAVLVPRINEFSALTLDAITADTKKGYTMTAYNTDLASLRSFVTNRYKFLTNHAELRPVPPTIVAVTGPATDPLVGESPFIRAQILPYASEGVDSVWLYHRGKSYGKFTRVQMLDDGAHGDGAAGDLVYGAAVAGDYASDTKVRYYVEARSGNAAKAAAFAPARAEEVTYKYHVALTAASTTPVVINEVMADNASTLADPQGEFDDWIELHNTTGQEVDLTGRYLSDEAGNPRKWVFPAGTAIPANGYLLVWADEDGAAAEGLHASFKLSASGEQLYLVDTDASQNLVLDAVTFGNQQTDLSYGRSAADSSVFGLMSPTPGQANR